MATEVVTDWSDELQGWIDRTPQKRMGTPEDIAGAYLYLASDASRYATGTELLIDGGYTAIYAPAPAFYEQRRRVPLYTPPLAVF